MTATLCFMAKGIHAALGAQVCVGTGLEVVVVTAWRTGCVKVARWAWCIVAWATVVELTGLTWAWALTWLAIAIACWAVIAWRAIAKLLGALAVARWAVTYTVTAHVAVGARGTAAFAALAATACRHCDHRQRLWCRECVASFHRVRLWLPQPSRHGLGACLSRPTGFDGPSQWAQPFRRLQGQSPQPQRQALVVW